MEQSYGEQLRALSLKFTDGLPEQLGALEAAWTRIYRTGWELGTLNDLIQQVHAMAGAASSLGFKGIAQSANELQVILINHSQNRNCEHNCLEEVETAFQSLREAIHTDQQAVGELIQKMDLAKLNTADLQGKRASRLIYMVDDDPIQVADLANQVEYFGYAVQIFNNLNDLESAIANTRPTALLMDISFPEGRLAGYDMIQALQNKFPDLPPVIFITVNDAINFRLQAVRVGGKAYFTKPVDVGNLIDVLDQLIFQDTIAPYQVLIVEDSRVQANYIAMQLKKAGMVTEIVAHPLEVVDHLISFNPDLLLLDMYMPDCTGMELAQIIRQMEQFTSLPIVFLSAETDRNKQLAALGIGADDFLTKPIEPEHLISAVTTRIERYRKMRTLMLHDGLTGLLNHITTKERLIQEVERARRQNEPLAFAMLDLDHFKQINDTYGHASGDRVLKSLSHLLQQRLRSTDTIGRYGGDEFAVILPNTGEKDAAHILKELCDGFAKVHHHNGDQEFTVTFSGGVAAFPSYDQAGLLSEAADLAAYAAKAAGGNTVISASEYSGTEFPSISKKASDKISDSLSATDTHQNLHRYVSNAILRCNIQGVILSVNEFALRIFGYHEADLIGRPFAGTLIPPIEPGVLEPNQLTANLAEAPTVIESKSKSGQKVWMAWNSITVNDENGRPLEIIYIGKDITEQKRTEFELARTVAHISAMNRISQIVANQQNLQEAVAAVAQEVVVLFKSKHVGIGLLSEDRTYLEFIGDSQVGWNLVQNQPNRVWLSDDLASAQVVESGRALFVQDAMHSLLMGNTHTLLEQHQLNGRAIIPLLVSGKVIGTMNIDFAEAGRVCDDFELRLAETIAGSIANMFELSNLFNAEQRQRQFFEALLENIPVAVEMIDTNARIQSWNPAAQVLFGYTADEAIGRNIDDLLSSEENRQEAVGYTQKSMQEGELIHSFTQRQRKDSTPVEVELLAVPLYQNGHLLGSLAIYHDISELQRARREAESANEAKSSFLATMSHEIRTPLNAIVGMTTLLMDTQLSQEQLDFTETIRSSSDALLSIINDILDFSKIEAGRMELEEQPFDLRECIESAFDLIAPKATEKEIDLAYLLDPNVPSYVISDSTRLRQILLNLLSNSIKFTDAGEVVLSVSVEKSTPVTDEAIQLHLAVRDTGIGIPSERKDRLFRSFSQVDASTTRKYGGTGLGLAISKRLSELMGGSMWVESEGIPGQGSTFHFSIRVRLSTNPVPVFLNARQPELSGRRALIVDDNATNRYILMRQVQSWGMIPQETSDPLQALAWIREGRQYDVALLDMQMPEMDGITLASEIQNGETGQTNLPLVMLTSLGIKEIGHEKVKFAAFLTKPIKPAVLYTTLLGVLTPQKVERKGIKQKPVIESLIEPLSHLRILMAEDMTVNQKVALLLLDRLGCRADVVSNGLEVLEALRRQAYDVILMDVQMPEMDGMEAARAVRSSIWHDLAKNGDSPTQPYIIAMTANAMQGDREACLAAGMDDYISKPVQIDELSQVLKRAVQARLPERSKTQAIPEISSSMVIDSEVFGRLQDGVGDENRSDLVSLVRDFLTESEQLAAEIQAASANGISEKIWRTAHSLKSISQMVGAMTLAQTCQAIELKGRTGDLGGISELIGKMEREFEAAQKAFQGWLDAN
jgi:diguanylate cyclase (GGDEF)-like protein/PAS domain S-box-containing protein